MANRFSLELSEKQLSPKNQLGGFGFERPTEGIEGKVFDVAEKVGGAVKTQFQESMQAQNDLLDMQRNLVRPFYESSMGRKLTEEERQRLSSHTFDELWNDIWINHEGKLFKQDYRKSKER